MEEYQKKSIKIIIPGIVIYKLNLNETCTLLSFLIREFRHFLWNCHRTIRSLLSDNFYF